MKTAIYPGSFDPITFGHLDIIERATTIFDKVIVAVAHNETKEPLLSTEDRMAHIRDSTYSNKKIEVDEFSGLLANYAASKKAAEALCYSYHHTYGLDVTVFRYFTVYGPAGRPDMAIFRFIKWIAEDEPLALYGDGTQE